MATTSEHNRFPQRLSQPGGTRELPVRGWRVEVDVQGIGPAIFFIHGFPLDRTMWRPVSSTLSGWLRIAPDLRTAVGVPFTDPAAGLGEFADDLGVIVDALATEPVVLCGLSMGGYIAFEMLRRYPERIRGLILCNTRAEADSSDGRSGREEMIALVERQGVDSLADRLLPKILAETSLETMPRVVEHVRDMMLRHTPAGITDALTAMMHRPDSTDLLAHIDVPTLVIAGAEDQLIPAEEARSMASRIAGSHFTIIPGAGHLAPLEQPVQTSRVIGEFLEVLS